MTSTAKDILSGWAPQIALMITVVGAAWALSGKLGRLEAKVEQNAVAIERNAQAIERNAQAQAQAIERNAQGIAEVQESLALLTGRYIGHLRHHNEAVASRR